MQFVSIDLYEDCCVIIHYLIYVLKKRSLFRIDYASTEKEKVHHWLFHAKYKIMKGYFFHILTAWIDIDIQFNTD